MFLCLYVPFFNARTTHLHLLTRHFAVSMVFAEEEVGMFVPQRLPIHPTWWTCVLAAGACGEKRNGNDHEQFWALEDNKPWNRRLLIRWCSLGNHDNYEPIMHTNVEFSTCTGNALCAFDYLRYVHKHLTSTFTIDTYLRLQSGIEHKSSARGVYIVTENLRVTIILSPLTPQNFSVR